MLEIFGEMYYIDLDAVGEAVNTSIETSSGETEQTINLVSFEVVKIMLEIIMTEREEVDENLGIHSTKNLSIPFKFAFNTLLKHQILKHL
mgnify:CR=1 FL=1|jgi:hypothetical protein|tara:strand:+ start:3896 stop:4165 length:270 start_codon:yes stop_codon:yes gene_type:complete